MNKVDYDIALELASHEALVRQTYKDSEGNLTWDVGMTDATGHSVARYIGKPASLQHCMNVYVWALKNYAEDVNKAFVGHKLTKTQFAGAVLFHWNTGAIKRASWVKKWKAGDIAGARRSFMDWRKPKEILGRRRKERELFFDGKWSSNGTMTEYTRVSSKMTPIWSSAKRINVEKELRKAFQSAPHPTIDLKPNLHSKPGVPTLSPPAPTTPKQPAKRPSGIVAALKAIFAAIAAYLKGKRS